MSKKKKKLRQDYLKNQDLAAQWQIDRAIKDDVMFRESIRLSEKRDLRYIT
jgi:hypothetical protein